MTIAQKLLVLTLILSGCSGNVVSDDDAVKKVISDHYDGVRLKDHNKMIGTITPNFVLYEFGKFWNIDSSFHNMDKYRYSMTYAFDNFKAMVANDKAFASYRARINFVFDDTLKQSFDFIETAAFEKTGGDCKMNFLQVNDQLPRYDTIHYAPEYYASRLAEFKKEPIKKGSVVLLGNSIIEYGNWKNLFGDSTMVNRGVAADNTFGVLKRLDDVIGRQPSKVILEIGINDVSQNIPLNIIIDNITTIVDDLHAGSPSTKIFVVSLLPTNDDVKNEYPDTYNKNRMSDVVNDQLRLRATERQYVYVDLNSKLRDTNGKLDRKFASEDGLHLNAEGYKVFVNLLRAN